MSDPDARQDPMDKAYVEAEAVLDDEDARAARRDRVLGAVAQERTAPAAAGALPSARRPAWRLGRWLAAACVAGLGLLAVTRIYQPAWLHPPVAPTRPAAPTASAQPGAAPANTPAVAGSQSPAPPPVAAPRTAAPAAPHAIANTASAPPPPSAEMQSREAFPAAAPPAPPPPPPPPAPSPTATVAADEAAADRTAEARGAAMQAPAAGLAAPSAAYARAKSSTATPSDQAARLRAAAAAGRTADVQALLAQGVPVDAPDAAGDTALMQSIQADQPAAAAALRRHGASLDRENNAGESARDMARTIDDASLNQALGLVP